MSLTSPDSNGIGRYVESTPVGTQFSAFLNLGLASVSAAITTLLARRAILGFRWAGATAMNSQTGMTVGDLGYRTDNGIIYRYNGATWKRWQSDWITYTPTLGGMILGTGGTNSCQFRYDNGRLRIKFRLTFGTSGQTFPTSPSLTLPGGTDPGGAAVLVAPAAANELMLGNVTLFDVGNSITKGHPRYNGTDTDKIGLVSNAATTSGTTGITTTVPFTWGSGDIMAGEAIMDVA